jgi:exonuclease SbcC
VRLHRLVMTAFGPFAGREEVDVDALAASGLFLLHGPTGAGKTSVLDAVCFALYGVVPGARASSGRLRSDHAAPEVAPQVVCEFSVGDRRLEVSRSPSWERPKRRGEGTTVEKMRVTVRERVEGAWVVRTSRADEAGHLLRGLLGLDANQFTKLVLLPQGEFAAFLRADAETRRAILEKLFDTGRFSDVQAWLRESQRALRGELDEARTVTRELLARADQACSRLPEGGADLIADGTDPDEGRDGASDGGELPAPRQVVAGRLARAVRAEQEATERRDGAARALRLARTAREQAEDLARRQAQYARLRAEAGLLDAGAAAHVGRAARLRGAERALGVAPAAAPLVEAGAALDAARARLASACEAASRTSAAWTDPGGALPVGDGAASGAGAGDVLDALDDDALSASSRALRERTGHLRSVAREASGLDEAVGRVRRLQALADQERQILADTLDRAAALGPTLAAETERLTEARALAGGLPPALEALAAAETVAGAAVEAKRLAVVVAEAEPGRARARERLTEARTRWLDLREQRLSSMAAELADGLRPGGACPVCGSVEHPSPAVSGPGRVTEQAEDAARALVEGAEAEYSVCEREAQDAVRRLAEVTGAAQGLDVEGARARLEEARRLVEAARTAAGGVAGRQDIVSRLTADLSEADSVAESARTRLNERESELAACRSTVADLHARVAEASGDDGSPAARAARLEAAAQALDDVLDARREVASAARAEAAARCTAASAATEAGFDDVADALEAVLPEPERLALERLVRDHDRQVAAVASRLADPALAAASSQEAPDVAGLAEACDRAEAEDRQSARGLALAAEAVAQLRGIAVALQEHLAVAEPLERRHRMAAGLARCADGTGGDNTLRMSLSAYVLASRLERVARMASERLGQMSGGRYTLVHSDEPGKGQQRSGLGLHVVDAWTGRCRDTTSLSGGESFYTSLALALGLADAVCAEAGGISIETLFVDEGFGSLDDDTLEEVMDVLDGLRSGGRTVGLVSHLVDLRQRVPAQIEVVKGRGGSRLVVGEVR